MPTVRLTKLSKALTAVAAVTVLAAGCTDSDGPDRVPLNLGQGDATLVASLERLDSCAAVEERLRPPPPSAGFSEEVVAFDSVGGDVSGAATGGGSASSAGSGAGEADVAVSAPLDGALRSSGDDSAALSAESAPAAGGDTDTGGAPVFSGTNVQESGVDEPDTVKTDGEVLYVLRHGKVHILRPGDLGTLATIDQPAGGENSHVQSLLLGDGVLIVLGGTWTEVRPMSAPAAGDDVAGASIAYGSSRTVMARYDVSDPGAPALVERTEVEGDLVSARLVGDVARVVTTHTVMVPYPQPRPGESPEAYQQRAAEAVEDLPADQLLPQFETTTGGDDVSTGPAVGCDAVYTPTYQTGPTTITVHTVGLDAGYQPGEAVTVIAGGQTVYATPERLYVATSRWGGGRFPMPVDGLAVDMAPGAETAVSDPAESGVTTELHAFAIAGDDPARYLGSGQVEGELLNQFSMSEHEGILRVATTMPDFDGIGGDSESAVVTLRLDGDALQQVGRVGGLGRGERIYSVRFIGDVGYVVTFRQVDPLYAVDLSDPANPVVRGELKIEGYSSYLHPVADDRLVGIGQDANLEGQRRGTQLSVFDVGDLDDPQRLSKLTFGVGSESAAEHDHHAFLWWPATDLFVLPLNVYPWDQGTGEPVADQFSGAVLVRLVGDELREETRLTHVEDFPEPWFTQIDRSLVIGDRLYTISEMGIASHGLDGFQRVGWKPFAEAQQLFGPGVGFAEPEPGLIDRPAPEADAEAEAEARAEEDVRAQG